MTPKYSISILAMNGLEMTRRCVESVLRHSPPGEFELFLTSNGATDGTAEYFLNMEEKHLGFVDVRAYSENQGFVKAHSSAFRSACGQYFIALNNDTEVPEKWLETLVVPFQNDERCAITGVEGGCCSVRVNATINHPKWGRMECPILGYHGKELEYIEGACLMVKRDLLLRHKQALFSAYFEVAYCEDTDLSFRVRRLGYSIHRVKLNISHIGSVTSNQVPGLKEIMLRNMAEFYRRWQYALEQQPDPRHRGRPLPRKLDHLVVIKRRGAVGDVLLTTPIIRAIHERSPGTKILVETNVPAIFTGNPHVHLASPQVRIPHGTQVIDLNGSYEANPERHILDTYCRLAMAEEAEWRTELFPAEADRDYATNTIEEGKWVALHAGYTTWKGKNWHPSNMDKIAQWLLAKGWQVVLIDAARHPDFNIPHTLDLRGDLNYQRLAAVLAKCSLFIGLDSFPIHAAQASGCPVVGLFGATLPELILTSGSPWRAVCADPTIPCAGERHRVANVGYTPCDGACMASIGVEDVQQAVEELI